MTEIYKGSTQIKNPDFARAVMHTNLKPRYSAMIAEGLSVDFAKVPHIMAAGTTGSGKSCFLHSLILSMLYNTLPSEARFLFIDPKMVEFIRYADDPHLAGDIVTDMDEAITALEMMERKMMERYRIMKEERREFWTGTHYFIVIDEIAELIFKSKSKAVGLLSSIARLGRASGIHLICATQLPTRQVLSNQVMANFECRVCLMCDDPVDYRTVLGRKVPYEPTRPGQGFCKMGGHLYEFAAPHVTRSDYEFFLKTCTYKPMRAKKEKKPRRSIFSFLLS